MATAQVKLGLLIVAIVAGTAMGQCDPNKCNYVVDVVSTLGDSSLSIFFAAANWQTVKGPGMNGNFNALAAYQFEIADTDCLDPCSLKLRVISGTNPNWVPASVRLRGFQGEDMRFDRKFTLLPAEVVTNTKTTEKWVC